MTNKIPPEIEEKSHITWLSALLFLSGIVFMFIGMIKSNFYYIVGGCLISLICEIDTGF